MNVGLFRISSLTTNTQKANACSPLTPRLKYKKYRTCENFWNNLKRLSSAQYFEENYAKNENNLKKLWNNLNWLPSGEYKKLNIEQKIVWSYSILCKTKISFQRVTPNLAESLCKYCLKKEKVSTFAAREYITKAGWRTE